MARAAVVSFVVLMALATEKHADLVLATAKCDAFKRIVGSPATAPPP